MTDHRNAEAQPYTPQTTPDPTGRLSWALGFIGWFPLPFLPLVVAAIAMIAARRSAERTGHPVARENARGAANWGYTILTVLVVFALYIVVIATAFPEFRQGFFPIGFAVIGYLVLAIAHGVLTIVGTVVAGRGVAVRPRIAIPVLRADRS